MKNNDPRSNMENKPERTEKARRLLPLIVYVKVGWKWSSGKGKKGQKPRKQIWLLWLSGVSAGLRTKGSLV